MRQPRSIAAAIALTMMVAAASMTVGTAAAQSDRQVDIVAAEDFDDTGEITVEVTGLDDFDGGTAAIYLCANADSDGEPIMASADDCFAPGDEGYVFGQIQGARFQATYVLRTEGIGLNSARCQIPDDEMTSCQLVVAATLDGDANITGVPLDALVARLTTADLVDDDVLGGDDADVLDTTAQPDELPVTGLSREATMVLLGAAAALVYLGYLFWSATAPARAAEPIRVRR